MKLEDDQGLCGVCFEEKADPDRDDGLCTFCGQISDKYNQDSDELFLDD